MAVMPRFESDWYGEVLDPLTNFTPAQQGAMEAERARQEAAKLAEGKRVAMLTEAKTKWCPMSRFSLVSPNGPAAVNRVMSSSHWKPECDALTRCLADGCAVWKWNGDRSAGWCGLKN